jgi:diguanylate cyclase (GGDEF)-like protein
MRLPARPETSSSRYAPRLQHIVSFGNRKKSPGLPGLRLGVGRTILPALVLLCVFAAAARAQAPASMKQDTAVVIGATVAGLVVVAAFAWRRYRRVAGAVSTISEIAERIAGGELDTAIPEGNSDEFSALLRAIAAMRDSIRAAMQAEASGRVYAQSRLMDAIETTPEGVVLVDAAGRIVVTNAPIQRFFGLQGRHEAPCLNISDLLRTLARNRLSEESLQSVGALTWKLDRDTPGTMELCLQDGMWLRVSWCATREGGLVAFFSDITESHRREAELAQTNIWFDAALTHLSEGLCVYDDDGKLKIFNTRFAEIFKLRRGQIRMGMAFSAVQQILDFLPRAALSERLADAPPQASLIERIALRQAFNEQQSLSDGRVIALSHRPISNGGWVLTYEDVTERTRSDARIAFMARHDSLTLLPNRTFFTERLDAALAWAQAGRQFALLLIDLDRFKEVNDTRGHPVGDRLLRVVADRLQGCSRAHDTVARLGGDEFAIIQMGVRNFYDAQDLAARVIAALTASYVIEGARLEVGASLGIALAPLHGREPETLLRSADTALYRAKNRGGNAYLQFSPSMDIELQERRQLEFDLQAASLDQEMELLYQPIVDILPPAADGGRGAAFSRPASSSVSPKISASSNDSAPGAFAAPASKPPAGPRIYASPSMSRPCSSAPAT